jgi:hypothetical protein
MIEKIPYLKCIIQESLLNGIIVKFDSFYFGYPSHDCLVNEKDVKRLEGNDGLVKLTGVSEINKTDSDSMKLKFENYKNYLFVQMNNLLEHGSTPFLVPKNNVVYL